MVLDSENVPVMNESGAVPTLDQLTRNKPARKSRRPTISILSSKANQQPDSTIPRDLELGVFGISTEERSPMDASSSLMSPPPEETLHKQGRTPVLGKALSKVPQLPSTNNLAGNAELPLSASKRKRQISSPHPSTSTLTNASEGTSVLPLTPNPKARKQLKRVTQDPESPTRSSFTPTIHISPPSEPASRRSASPSKRGLLESPHTINPNADFIPPTPSHSRSVLSARNRRSITPAPPYEPPKERFTPPREVLGTPIGGKPTKKKPASKRSGKQLKLVIKEEPPELDLTQPAPPASPTEDPLLLAGSPSQPRSKAIPRISPSLPPTSSPWGSNEAPATIGYVGTDTSDTSFNQEPREDDIVFPAGEWSDSDDGAGDFNQSGEFTGKFTTLRIPTKADPPSSVTKVRQDAWGRPVSPFPYPIRRSSRWSSPLEPMSSPEKAPVVNELPGLDDDNLDQMNIDDPTPPPEVDQSAVEEHAESTPVKASPSQQFVDTPGPSRLIPSSVPSMFNFNNINPAPQPPKSLMQEIAVVDKEIPHALPETVEDRAPVFAREKSVAEEEQEEEQLVDRELSEGLFEDAPAYRLTLPSTPAAPYEETSEHHGEHAVYDSDESEENEGLDLGIIKITSEDPMAAARAAAILKLHNYDALTRPLKRNRSYSTVDSLIRDARRRSASTSGVSKDLARRRTLGGVIGDKVFMRDSPVRTLPELLKEAEGDLEKSVVLPGNSAVFRTPVKTRQYPHVSPLFRQDSSPGREASVIEPRDWKKSDWKLLDACFTDERLDLAERQGLPEGALADVQDVDLSDVVDRFVQVIGGDVALKLLGSSWTRQDVLKRTRALEKKQRAGKGAPGTPARGRTPAISDTSTQIDVPDFTPSSQRYLQPTASQPSDNAKLPATLLAPRYSHLMDEAVSISKGKERAQSPGLFKRLTSPIFSYLPTLSKAPVEPPKPADQQGLPLPPPEMFEKDRGPIITPVAKPAPKPAHPKDLVHLNSAPVSKPSMIPRVKTKPQRLVELRPAPRPESPPIRHIPSGRRSSGGSVKDLVKTFEKLDESIDFSRSMSSINDWRTDAPGAKPDGKPKWKP